MAAHGPRHPRRLDHRRRRLDGGRQRRWPDVLATRLQADPALASIAVVNAGISGNRILNDGRAPFIGPSSLSRFDRDVLARPGVRFVILLQGSNDISASDMLPTPEDHVSASQIIDGIKALIARADAERISGSSAQHCFRTKA